MQTFVYRDTNCLRRSYDRAIRLYNLVILQILTTFSPTLKKIKEKFKLLFLGNGCDITKLKSEAEIIFNHIKNFASAKSSIKTWPVLYSLKHEHGITNILHIAKTSIAFIASLNQSKFFIIMASILK